MELIVLLPAFNERSLPLFCICYPNKSIIDLEFLLIGLISTAEFAFGGSVWWRSETTVSEGSRHYVLVAAHFSISIRWKDQTDIDTEISKSKKYLGRSSLDTFILEDDEWLEMTNILTNFPTNWINWLMVDWLMDVHEVLKWCWSVLIVESQSEWVSWQPSLWFFVLLSWVLWRYQWWNGITVHWLKWLESQ